MDCMRPLQSQAFNRGWGPIAAYTKVYDNEIAMLDGTESRRMTAADEDPLRNFIGMACSVDGSGAAIVI